MLITDNSSKFGDINFKEIQKYDVVSKEDIRQIIISSLLDAAIYRQEQFHKLNKLAKDDISTQIYITQCNTYKNLYLNLVLKINNNELLPLYIINYYWLITIINNYKNILKKIFIKIKNIL